MSRFEGDKNWAFANKYAELYNRQLCEEMKNYSQELRRREELYRNLPPADQVEYINLLTLKIRSMFDKNSVLPDFKFAVLLLLFLAHHHSFEYSKSDVEAALKAIFASKNVDKLSNPDLVKIFTSYQFDVRDYELLIYEKTLIQRFISWFG